MLVPFSIKLNSIVASTEHALAFTGLGVERQSASYIVEFIEWSTVGGETVDFVCVDDLFLCFRRTTYVYIVLVL